MFSREDLMTRRFIPAAMLAFLAPIPTALGTAATFAQNPAAHCASVGADDRVRPLPAALVPAARRLFAPGANEPDAALKASTVYRCMSGQVWLCNTGANLTCAKGDVRRESRGATAWCKDHPGSDIVPMVATGHATIFTWACVGSEPSITQAQKLDARGFIARQWAPLGR
jgi:hypothetical protein